MNQITNGMGLDIRDLIQATLTGRATGQAIAQSQQEPAKVVETID